MPAVTSPRTSLPSSTPRNPSSSADTQVASTVAGITSRVLLHPVDCVKTRLQHLRGRPGHLNVADHLRKFIAREGIGGLYRGIFGALAGVVPYSMLYMPSYELAQMQLGVRFGPSQLLGLRHVVAGSFAGLCGSLVKVPVDVVKKRLQAGIYPNIAVAVRSIAAEEQTTMPFGKVRRFYTGWRSSIFYDVPYNAVQFTVLENVKRIVKQATGREKLGRLDNVVVGALTGMITSVITEPLDVIKTRMMTQKFRNMQQGITLYNGWLHCMKTIIREEGPVALWKGTLPRLVWVGASSAIWYGTYQAARQTISARRSQAHVLQSEGDGVD